MTLTDRIEMNPRVMLGKPVLRGTRIPAELVLRKLSEGVSEADLMDRHSDWSCRLAVHVAARIVARR